MNLAPTESFCLLFGWDCQAGWGQWKWTHIHPAPVAQRVLAGCQRAVIQEAKGHGGTSKRFCIQAFVPLRAPGCVHRRMSLCPRKMIGTLTVLMGLAETPGALCSQHWWKVYSSGCPSPAFWEAGKIAFCGPCMTSSTAMARATPPLISCNSTQGPELPHGVSCRGKC